MAGRARLSSARRAAIDGVRRRAEDRRALPPAVIEALRHHRDFPTQRRAFQWFSAGKSLNRYGTVTYDSNSNRPCPAPNRRRSSYSMPQKMFKKKCKKLLTYPLCSVIVRAHTVTQTTQI